LPLVKEVFMIIPESTEILSKYIRIDTTNPPGNEAKAAQFFAEIFDKEKIPYQTYESYPKRVSLKAKLTGSGQKGPIILLNHMDVVFANSHEYTFDPFGGKIIDGYICGRGALDMKSIGVMQLMAILAMRREEVSLNRDLVFLAVADEETGGSLGMKYLMENYPDDFNAALVLNEGGQGFSNMLPDKMVMLFATAEKGPCWLKLSCQGPSGHGSTPHSQNALVKMTQALNRLLSADLPVIITPIVEEYFKKLSSEWSFLQPFKKDGQHKTLARVLKKSGMLEVPQINAMVRNTISLNILKAGNKINVIPDYAEAELDIRLLPGQDINVFVDFVREKLADSNIKIEKILTSEGNVSDTNSEDFIIIRDVLNEHFQNSLLLFHLMSGLTDSRFFREKGITAYGFSPFSIPIEHLNMIHGADEKISIDNMVKGTAVYIEMVRKLCT
jgi:acetylornithine deacetylase/succinyl-diaminopimelate desuccinylase-like protein